MSRVCSKHGQPLLFFRLWTGQVLPDPASHVLLGLTSPVPFLLPRDAGLFAFNMPLTSPSWGTCGCSSTWKALLPDAPKAPSSPPSLFQCLRLTDNDSCPIYNCNLPPSLLLVPPPLICFPSHLSPVRTRYNLLTFTAYIHFHTLKYKLRVLKEFLPVVFTAVSPALLKQRLTQNRQPPNLFVQWIN